VRVVGNILIRRLADWSRRFARRDHESNRAASRAAIDRPPDARAHSVKRSDIPVNAHRVDADASNRICQPITLLYSGDRLRAASERATVASCW